MEHIKNPRTLGRGVVSSGETELNCDICGLSSEWCVVKDGKIVCPKCEEELDEGEAA